jgi:SAM-dependent methyltransferase
LAHSIPATGGMLELLLLGAYRPLATVADKFLAPTDGGALARVWQRQIDEPARERSLRDGIPAFTPVEDTTSLAVQHQYEENPYPRWHRLPGSFSTAFPLRRALRSLFPKVDLSRLRVPDSPDILIAGCGTGFHAAITAARNPSARITALDLSRTSLAYATRRCSELGLTHVRFALADILELQGWEKRFDCVECTGVLHHLRDPLTGWAVLAALVKPGGVLKIALYSERARRGVVAARELIAERGFGASLDGIRAARVLVFVQPPDSPVRQLLDSPDFYTASGTRDLMLHAEEHRFDTAQLAETIDALGLVFLGFELIDADIGAEYRRRFPDDPSATSLENWGRFEAERPNIFAGMYQFWVAKPG